MKTCIQLAMMGFLLISFCSRSTTSDLVTSNPQSLHIRALGRTARLGSLYDARTDTFTGISIFNKNIPSTLITTTGTPTTHTKMGITRSYEDKNEFLQISESMSLKVLAGLFSIEGSGRYLKDSAKKSNNVVGAFLYETLTCEQMLEIFYDEMKGFISPAVLEVATETHVVVGIGWGANAIVKFEDTNQDSRTMTDISSKMEESLDWLFSGKYEISSSSGGTDVSRLANYTIEIFGDLTFGGKDFPKNASEVINFIEKIPSFVNQSNEGKGRELSFHLLPIQRVKDFMTVKNTTTPSYFDLTPASASPYLSMFQQYSRVGLKLKDLYTNMMNYRNVLYDEDLDRIEKLQQGFINSTLQFKAEMKDYLLAFSSGNHSHPIHALKAQNHFYTNEFSPGNTEQLIDSNFTQQHLKVKLVKLAQRLNPDLIWVARSESLDSAKVDLYDKFGLDRCEIVVTNYFPEHLEHVKAFLEAVLRCEDNKTNCIPIVVDCDFMNMHPHCNKSDDSVNLEKAVKQSYDDLKLKQQGNEVIETESETMDSKTTFALSSLQKEQRKLHKQILKLKADMKAQPILNGTDRGGVPLGYIYIQVPKSDSPKELWPGLSWKEISKDLGLEGSFLRVANGNTVLFPNVYSTVTGKGITAVEEADRGGDDYVSLTGLNGWTGWLYTGNSAGNGRAIRFYVNGDSTDGPVPQHAAIQIWKRIA